MEIGKSQGNKQLHDGLLDLVNRLPLLVAGLQGHSGHVHPLVCVPQLVLHSPQAASELNVDMALKFLQ